MIKNIFYIWLALISPCFLFGQDTTISSVYRLNFSGLNRTSILVSMKESALQAQNYLTANGQSSINAHSSGIFFKELKHKRFALQYCFASREVYFI